MRNFQRSPIREHLQPYLFIHRIKKDENARLAELENSVKEKDMKSRMILEEKRYATKTVGTIVNFSSL